VPGQMGLITYREIMAVTVETIQAAQGTALAALGSIQTGVTASMAAAAAEPDAVTRAVL
jgi:hypothetical protein